ncbi:MAG: cupin domain-containing protein [Betaproteobacteria bacterium]
MANTPFMPTHEGLSASASRYVNVDALPWKPTASPGIDIKVLMEDKDSGLLTALFRWAPGSQLGLHEHIDIEQTYILSGSLVDEEGEARTGDYVWRPKGSRHIARSPDGALILAFFLKPNKFFSPAEAASMSASSEPAKV